MNMYKRIFVPQSVALIGASSNPEKYGHWTAKTLAECGYQGKLYFVSRSSSRNLFGVQTVASISEIEDIIDLVIVAIAPKFIVNVLEECGEKGVAGAVIVSTGFGETGENGKLIEAQLKEISNKYYIRIMGPNSMGFYNSRIRLNSSIVDLAPGNVGLVAQSGNFGADINFNLKRRNLGYSIWATIGNQIDLRFHELISYLKSDEETNAILAYIEGLRVDSIDDGRRFIAEAKEACLTKPIIAIKIGRTRSGARAAASHTGSLSGSETIFNTAFRQAGILRVNNTAEMMDLAEAFLSCEQPEGNRLAILTDGGGHGVMATDDAGKFGLSVPILSDETQVKLRDILPKRCPMKNPVDLAGTPESDLWIFTRCMEILLEDPGIDALVIVGFFGGYALLSDEFEETERSVAKKMVELKNQYKKPVILHSLYYATNSRPLSVLSEGGIPVYPVIESAIKVMAGLRTYRENRERIQRELSEASKAKVSSHSEKVNHILTNALKQGRKSLLEPECLQFLQICGVATERFEVCKAPDEAVKFAHGFNVPMAMKIISEDILHKTDAGGVKLNVFGGKAAKEAYEEIISSALDYNNKARIQGVMITPMAQNGLECIIGGSRDATFGPTVMFGLGGIHVELLKDTSFRIAPVNSTEALSMIQEIRAYPLISGYRGSEAVNQQALADLIETISTIIDQFDRIEEIDLNPVIARPDGLTIVDARVILN